jgi:hypothetical protein
MMQVLTTILCVVAFALLAFAMERHQLALFARQLPPGQTRALRVAGWCALGLTLWIIVAGQGWALGLVGFSGVASLSAGLVYGALIVCERVKRSGRRSGGTAT